MQTEFNTLTDNELVARIYSTGDFTGWPAEAKELFFRTIDRSDRLRAQAEDRERLQLEA